MNTSDEYGSTQQIQIRIRENALNFIDILIGESEFLQRIHSVLNMEE